MNLAQFALMFVLVGMVGNSNEVFHYRMAVERSLVNGDYKKALTIGENRWPQTAALPCFASMLWLSTSSCLSDYSNIHSWAVRKP